MRPIRKSVETFSAFAAALSVRIDVPDWPLSTMEIWFGELPIRLASSLCDIPRSFRASRSLSPRLTMISSSDLDIDAIDSLP